MQGIELQGVLSSFRWKKREEKSLLLLLPNLSSNLQTSYSRNSERSVKLSAREAAAAVFAGSPFE